MVLLQFIRAAVLLCYYYRYMISPEKFHRHYRRLILLTWTLPAIVGLSFLMFIEMFSTEQMLTILTTPLEPVFIIAGIIFAYWYFHRFARPFTAWFENNSTRNETAVLQQIRRFPLHFWLLFLSYILLAPASVIISAQRYTDFVALPVDWFRIHLVALIVSIIVGLPFFFRFFDLFGQAFGSIHNQQPVLTIKTRVFLIASLIPLLMDTMLVQYYWTRTGYFTLETFVIWLMLEFLAIAGSLLFIRSFSQSLAPLQLFIQNFSQHSPGMQANPVSCSTDELGFLTYDLGLLLEEQHLHREILAISNRLLRQAGFSSNYEELLANIIHLGNDILDDEVMYLMLFDESCQELVGVIDSFNGYRKDGYFRLSLNENSFAVTVFKQAKPLAITDVKNDPRVNARLTKKYGICSALAVPLIIGDKPVGVLLSARKKITHHYNEHEILILQAFAQETALIIHTESLDSNRLSAEQRYRKLVELAPDAILLLDENGIIVEINQAAGSLFLQDSSSLTGHSLNNFLGKKQSTGIERLLQLQPGQSSHLESVISTRNIIVDIHAGALILDENKVIQIIIQDISQRKRLESAITQIVEGISTAIGESFFQAIATQLTNILGANGVTIGTIKNGNADTVYTIAFYLNGKMRRNVHYCTQGTPCAEVIGNTPKTYPENVQALFPNDNPLVEMDIEAYSGVPLFDSQGKPMGLIATLFKNKIEHPEFIESVLQIFAARTAAEIERTQREEHIKHLAYYDTLTRLPNRELLMDRLHQGIAQASRNQSQLALMLLDLDHFKSVNDTLGHPVGDLLLSQVAQRLKDCVREGDTVARLGGDEFVILLPSLPSSSETSIDVTIVADKIRHTISDTYFLEGHDLSISTSIGIAFYPADGENARTLFKHADMAMYQAKGAGRDNYRFFSKVMNDVAIERLEIESELRQALSKNQFQLLFQPKVDIIHNHIVGAEALLRWQHPQRGLIPPDKFIPISEDTGQIMSIGSWVFEQACQAAAELWCNKKGDEDIQTMSVNVSPQQFRHPNFVAQVKDILAKTSINPKCIEIEVTENLLIHDYAEVRGKLEELKTIGLHISIDDFGTGYSSLRYLQQLPVDIVKIDHSFVRNIDTNPANAAIVETIIAMATRLGLEVVAEGVETRRQLAYLRVQGCTICQGFYFSKPLSLAEFSKLLTQGLKTRTLI
ncbi:diguanylate cyclase/phosphodiesterase (GGDEF & EAL domains) with PAS/PAC sensor(s) [hydrothermal vent metagenome]|uniref:Diguanylate cyclase/phosphodiesterase (GGDEF & EAL domains) with PAS/PAC sensor(S) n=1 Tax=hydrothermal vent metagenome TaxID=652676 RepID=A0A3B1B2U0_9ZZZZ